MKTWGTEIKAIDPKDGVLKTWCGINVQAPSRKLAQEWCDNNGHGYCKVTDELIMEISANSDEVTDYTLPQNN